MSGLIYLITGANRGIGKGLLSAYVSHPNTTVIAAVRDVASATTALNSVPTGKGSKIIIVKIDSTIDTDPEAAAQELKTKHNITKIDVLIANAGILGIMGPVLETPADQIRKHVQVNTIAPLLLLQAFKPLLDASSFPRFLVITSTLGSIGKLDEYRTPTFAYGISKAAANYLTRKVAMENPKLLSAAFNPGWVQTEMGNTAAVEVGMEAAPTTLEESIRTLVEVLDGLTIEKTGTFIANTGETIPW